MVSSVDSVSKSSPYQSSSGANAHSTKVIFYIYLLGFPPCLEMAEFSLKGKSVSDEVSMQSSALEFSSLVICQERWNAFLGWVDLCPCFDQGGSPSISGLPLFLPLSYIVL